MCHLYKKGFIKFALLNGQADWAMNGEKNLVTGVLLWDLSAAFDTLDCEGVCAKLKLLGVQTSSLDLIRSFLSGRSQRIKLKKSNCYTT